MEQLKRWPLGKLRDAKPASLVGKFPEPMNFEHDGGPRLAKQYSAYYSPHHRGAWPSLNYTRGRKYAKSSSAGPLDSYATRNPRRSPCPSMAMLPEPKDYEILCILLDA